MSSSEISVKNDIKEVSETEMASESKTPPMKSSWTKKKRTNIKETPSDLRRSSDLMSVNEMDALSFSGSYRINTSNEILMSKHEACERIFGIIAYLFDFCVIPARLLPIG